MAACCLAEDIVCGEQPDDIFAPAPLARMGREAREEYWATLSLRHCRGVGARSQARLLKHFGSAGAACANLRAWPECKVSDAKAREFSLGVWQANAKKEWQNAIKCGAAIILWKSSAYPRFLRELPDAPPLLYACGSLNLLAGPAIAMVGSRNPSRHGLAAADSFGRALSAAGLTVVSGVALGIDRQAHAAALAEIGRTIGVLGTGIDIAYPASNKDIFKSIARDGLLLSEFPPGTPPAPANFPVRNRIISGLSVGVVVVEAAERSGSLVTARLALEQNREVFAIPGPALDGRSAGCQQLVRQGARPVFFPEDVLRDLAQMLKSYGPVSANGLGLQARRPDIPLPGLSSDMRTVPSAPANAEAQQAAHALLGPGDAAPHVLAAIEKAGAMQIDALCGAAGMSTAELTPILLGLELTGKIRRLPGARFEAV